MPLVFFLVIVLSKFPLYLHIAQVLFQISNVTTMVIQKITSGRRGIQWPQHQPVFLVSLLFGLQPLPFSYSIWLLYWGTWMSVAWPRVKAGDLHAVLSGFTYGLRTPPKPSGNASQLFVFLPSSPLFGLPKIVKSFRLENTFKIIQSNRQPNKSTTNHVPENLISYPCSRH